jgi:hypothetical protein
LVIEVLQKREGAVMKYRSIAMLTALVTIMLSAAVSAAPTSKDVIQLSEQMIIGSVALLPGEYTVEWNGAGPDVQVSFSRRDKTIAIVPATLQAEQNHPYEFLVTTQAHEFRKRLLEFHMKSWTLHFAPRGDEYTFEWNGTGPDVSSGN